MRRLYRRGGATLAVGNTVIPIPVGKGVGGTTTINSGTCFRVPGHTLAEWSASSGVDLAHGQLDPYYDEVARDLEIAPSPPSAIGRAGDLVARGCDALGWSHHPLARNAPGCDGQGLCAFGCPTDAKRSTNVSYVPRALAAGATCATGTRVHRVVVEGGRATGVEATTSAGTLRVRARAVVLACGTLHTAALLLSQGLAARSGQVGRNLSIHPATASMGLFDEAVGAFAAVPQGYGIDEFHDEGLLFEGSSLPLEITGAMTPGFGPAWTALMDEAQRSLLFGFLVKDSSRGRVRAGPGGSPRITYWLNRRDTQKVHRGLALLARCFFAAGAREVVQPAMGHQRLRGLACVARFERARLAARHFDLTAYHPVGTCRMGADPARSVVGPSGELHEVPGLYACDASIFPGSPGVNPQWTIMALSLRVADGLVAALA
jgi:choline dehydrogenase-like flavoprotein